MGNRSIKEALTHHIGLQNKKLEKRQKNQQTKSLRRASSTLSEQGKYELVACTTRVCEQVTSGTLSEQSKQPSDKKGYKPQRGKTQKSYTLSKGVSHWSVSVMPGQTNTLRSAPRGKSNGIPNEFKIKPRIKIYDAKTLHNRRQEPSRGVAEQPRASAQRRPIPGAEVGLHSSKKRKSQKMEKTKTTKNKNSQTNHQRNWNGIQPQGYAHCAAPGTT